MSTQTATALGAARLNKRCGHFYPIARAVIWRESHIQIKQTHYLCDWSGSVPSVGSADSPPRLRHHRPGNNMPSESISTLNDAEATWWHGKKGSAPHLSHTMNISKRGKCPSFYRKPSLSRHCCPILRSELTDRTEPWWDHWGSRIWASRSKVHPFICPVAEQR